MNENGTFFVIKTSTISLQIWLHICFVIPSFRSFILSLNIVILGKGKGRGKGKVPLEQAMKAQRGSRGIVLLFL